ncbi:MAG: hypothetical protein IJX02_09070 [Clostridia bacterium]|nr:hypothetical protein [Clostridia bacterium]
MKKFKIPLLYLLSFALSILPVAIYFFLNRERYFVTLPERVKLTTGLVCLGVIVLLKVMGKLKMPSRAVLFGLVFILCYLMESVLNDMLVFSFLALVGEIMDMICQVFVKRAKEEKATEKMAQATTAEITKILNGRV